MDEQEVLAKALAFEYYVAVIDVSDMGEPSPEDAMGFYKIHKEQYLDKANKLLGLISESYSSVH